MNGCCSLFCFFAFYNLRLHSKGKRDATDKSLTEKYQDTLTILTALFLGRSDLAGFYFFPFYAHELNPVLSKYNMKGELWEIRLRDMQET